MLAGLTRELRTSVLAIVAFTVLLGLAYPLAITGIAQVAFKHKADGSLVVHGGKVTGSRLIGAARVVDTGAKDPDGNAITRPDPRYFQPRPSATGYSAEVTSFANRGPNSAAARYFYRDGLRAYLRLNRPGNPGLTAPGVPADAVTASASGVDPHISEADARIQARRVAAARRFLPERVAALVRASTSGRLLGVVGERVVNVTDLNVALDREAS
jgi:K+-transporting ATPase ATPase C chain